MSKRNKYIDWDLNRKTNLSHFLAFKKVFYRNCWSYSNYELKRITRLVNKIERKLNK